MSNLIKILNKRDGSDGGKLFFGRADLDGMPFRGNAAPMLTEEEADDRLVRVADFRNGTFSINNSVENQNYCNVCEGIARGWFQLVFVSRLFDAEKTKIYIEWVEYYLEDRTPVPVFNGKEAGRGSGSFGFDPPPA